MAAADEPAEQTHAEEEEEEGEAAAQPATQQQQGRRGPVCRGRRRQASQPPAEAEEAAEEAEQEAAGAAALDDHAMPLSAGQGRRRSSRRLSQRKQQQQDEEDEEQSGASPPGPRRRRKQQHKRPAQLHAAEHGPQSPEGRQQHGQQAGRVAEQQEDEQEWLLPAELTGPPVLEDLGPEARSQQYHYDWEERCWRGLEELFLHFFTVDELRDLVEQLAEDWEEGALYCLKEYRKEKGGPKRWIPHKRPEKIVKKLLNLLSTGRIDGKDQPAASCAGGMSRQGLQELLRLPCCDPAVQRYNAPDTEDHQELVWELWRVPVGPALPPDALLWGSRRFACARIDGGRELEPGSDMSVPWRHVWRALLRGDLRLEGQDEHMEWLGQVDVLSQHSRFSVEARLNRNVGHRSLRIALFQSLEGAASSVLNAAMRVRADDESEDDSEEEPSMFDPFDRPAEAVLGADLALVLGQLDQLKGTAAAEALDRLMAGYRQTERQVLGRGLAAVLPVHAPLSKAQFETVIKPCLEEMERAEPAGFQQLLESKLLLKASLHSRLTVAHMLEKERQGSMADLWVQLTPPGQPGLHWFVSPVLRQSRVFASKLEAEHWVRAAGGAGWVVPQVGMGKTLCAVAVTVLNPLPPGWRKNRAYQTACAGDHLAGQVNNIPHGGTLIVAPTAIVSQWAAEFRKTTAARLSIMRWVDGTKANPLQHNARSLACYDVVLTDMNTLKQASNMNTISSIRWHRVVVDESQQSQCAALLNNRELLFSHAWLLTGTPDNENNLDSMAAQYGFLKLGPYGPLHTHMPAALTHALKSCMVFYSKHGQLDGHGPNLELPPLDERIVECELSAEDARWYRELQQDQRTKFNTILWRAGINPNSLGDEEDPHWAYCKSVVGRHMAKLRPLIVPLRQAAASAYKQLTGTEHYDASKGAYVKDTRTYSSKVEAVLDVLRGKAPAEKVVVFSEFQPLLRAIKARLPELGLDSRDLIGSSKSEKRGQAINDFQTAPPTQVSLCPHRTGGAGVTLTAGTHVILCEPVLNPTFEEQAIGRCNRFGQTVSVRVTRLVMKGTIEEKIVEFMKQRDGTEGDALVDRSSKLSIEDLQWFVHEVEPEETGEC
ncbi:hypothetical protein ABPG75_010961 [Micractinium tetrahymenae]